MLKSWTQFLRAGHRETVRGLRIPLETPLRFRRLEEKSWSCGIAVNISSSGVLLHSDKNMDVQTAVQMIYMLPITIADKNGIVVLSKGEVVRAKTPPGRGGKLHFAVKIVDYYPGTQWKPHLRRIVGDDRGPTV